MAISTSDCKTFLDTHQDLADHGGDWKRLSKTKDADGVARVFARDDGSWFVRVIETPAGLALTHQGPRLDDVAAPTPKKVDTVCLVHGNPEDHAAAQALIDAGLSETDDCSDAALALGAAFTNRMLFAIIGTAVDTDMLGEFETDGHEDEYWTVVFVPDKLWQQDKTWHDQGLPLSAILEEGSFSPNETSEWFVRIENAKTLREATRALLDKGFVWSESLMRSGAEQMDVPFSASLATWARAGADLSDAPRAKQPRP